LNTDSDEFGNACDVDDDNDGLPDIAESQIGTSPLVEDTGGEGANDKVEELPLDSTATIGTDVDGIGDHNDNCRLRSNRSQTDSDVDGFGDACDIELIARGLNPLTSNDGQFAVFLSFDSTLVVVDTSNINDAFLYDAQSGSIQRVSSNDSRVRNLRPPSSDDGRLVTFAGEFVNPIDVTSGN
jgi:hypothetical protein